MQDVDTDSMDKVSNTSQPEVDEEGYTVRKERPVKEDDSWDSSSDSGSDNEDKTRSKLKVRSLTCDILYVFPTCTPLCFMIFHKEKARAIFFIRPMAVKIFVRNVQQNY